jgi:hypothetical protein
MRNRLMTVVSRNQTIGDFLDALYGAGGAEAIGFKLMLSEAQRFPEVLDYLRQRHIRAIHVLRRNALNTLISRETARLTGVYHMRSAREVSGNGAAKPPRERPRLYPRSLIADLRVIAAEDAKWRALIAGEMPVHRTVYEDFVTDPAGCSAGMLQFLDVPPATLTSELKKIVPDDWRAAIANPDEIALALKTSEFEALLSHGLDCGRID